MMTAKDYFNGLTPEQILALEDVAVADPFVHKAVAGGAMVLMEELLLTLEENKGAKSSERIEAMVDLLARHCVRGFSLGFGYAQVLNDQAAVLGALAVDRAKGN